MIVIIALLYHATPNAKQPKFRWVSLGALLAIVVLVIASAGFALYVANFSNYDRTYGSLAGAIVFLLWLWIANNALLFGAEFDAELERGRELEAGIAAEERIQLPPARHAQDRQGRGEGEGGLDPLGRRIRKRTPTTRHARPPEEHPGGTDRSEPSVRWRSPQQAGSRLVTVPAVNLGMPKVPEVLAPRRKSRQIKVGKVLVGGDAQVSVQSMTTTPTPNINATLQQIAELTASGCEIVRVAVPTATTPRRCPSSRRRARSRSSPTSTSSRSTSTQAIDAGCAAVRVNPGNIRKFDDQVGEIAKAREGGGRLDPHRRERRIARPAPAREVRQGHARGARRDGRLGGEPLRGARLPRLQDLGQAQRPDRHGEGVPPARRARRLAAAPRRHRGGSAFQGTIKTATAFGILLARASATRSASRCPRRPSRRSRWACRSCSR